MKHPAIDVNLEVAGVTPLQAAVKNGQTAVVGELLGAPEVAVNQANEDGDTALHMACHAGSLGMVKQLLGHPQVRGEAERDTCGFLALSIACDKRDIPLINLLVEMLDEEP